MRLVEEVKKDKHQEEVKKHSYTEDMKREKHREDSRHERPLNTLHRDRPLCEKPADAPKPLFERWEKRWLTADYHWRKQTNEHPVELQTDWFISGEEYWTAASCIPLGSPLLDPNAPLCWSNDLLWSKKKKGQDSSFAWSEEHDRVRCSCMNGPFLSHSFATKTSPETSNSILGLRGNHVCMMHAVMVSEVCFKGVLNSAWGAWHIISDSGLALPFTAVPQEGC